MLIAMRTTLARKDVVLVSPTDVQPERERAELVINELNRGVAEHLGITIRLLRWETSAHPGLHRDGSQAQIAKALKIPDADLVVGIFWKRFGTPVQDADSGTESELRSAWESWLKAGTPDVMLYFCERGFFPTSKEEADQLSAVLDFKGQLPAQQLYWSYSDTDEFERMLREHLTRFLTSPVDAETARRAGAAVEPKPSAAMVALTTRLAEMECSTSQISVSAHNLDQMFEVDLVETDNETVVSYCTEEAGGSGANTSTAVAKLGCSAATTGIVADDGHGRALMAALCMENLQARIKCVRHDRDFTTGHTMVVSDRHGRRSIYVNPGVNERWAETLTPVERNELIRSVSEAKIVHFTSFTGSEEMALQREILAELPNDTIVSFNPGALYVRRKRSELKPFIDRMNVMTIYESQLSVLVANLARTQVNSATSETDDARTDLERLFTLRDNPDTPLLVLVKRYRPLDARSVPSGRLYALAVAGGARIDEMVYPQPDKRPRSDTWSLIDSTGAGDAMAAGVHIALLRGADLQECVNIAFIMAMEVSNHTGARSGQPSLERLREAWGLWFRSKCPACLD